MKKAKERNKERKKKKINKLLKEFHLTLCKEKKKNRGQAKEVGWKQRKK